MEYFYGITDDFTLALIEEDCGWFAASVEQDCGSVALGGHYRRDEFDGLLKYLRQKHATAGGAV